MTRGAKIVVFSVVGLFVLAGIYYGFMAPTTPTEPFSDSTPQVSESPTLTMTPAIDGQPLNGMGNALPEIGGTTIGTTTGTTTGTMTANPNGFPAVSDPAFAPSSGFPIGTPSVVTQILPLLVAQHFLQLCKKLLVQSDLLSQTRQLQPHRQRKWRLRKPNLRRTRSTPSKLVTR